MARLRDLKTRPRAIYQRNPLAEVIAAVRFPRQLSLEERLPVEFQEAVKTDYPLLRLKNAVLLSMQFSVNEDTPTPTQLKSKIYEFASDDQKYLVSVLPDTLALTTTAYTRWEDFVSRYMQLLKTLHEIYQLPLFTRVGLRYKDTIDRASLGLADVPWDRLVSADLLHPFTFFSSDLEQHPSLATSIVLELDGAQMRVNFGFVEDDQRETGFLIDTDCYVEPAKIRTVAEVGSTFEGLHKYTSLAFNACISDELHNALRPTDV